MVLCNLLRHLWNKLPTNSNYVAEHQLLHSGGGSTEETLRARISADIIVDPGLGEDEDTGAAPRTVRSLDTALAIAKDGDKIFLEEGRHTRAQGWQVGGIMIMIMMMTL